MPFSLADSPHASRRERLRSLLAKRKLSGQLVTKPENLFYLTGFRGSAGAAIFAGNEAVLWVDPRYTLQAREQVPSATGVSLIEERQSLLKGVARWLRK